MQDWHAELGAPRSTIMGQPPVPASQTRYISMLGSLRAQLLDSHDKLLAKTISRVDWKRITLARKIMTKRREERIQALMMEQQARREREASLLNRSMPVRMPINYRRLIPSDIIRQVPFGNHPFDAPITSRSNLTQLVNAERVRLFSPLELRAPQLANIFNVPYSSSRVRERALRAGRRSGTGRLITTSPFSGHLETENMHVSAAGMKSVITGAPRPAVHRNVEDNRGSIGSRVESYRSPAPYAARPTGYREEQYSISPKQKSVNGRDDRAGKDSGRVGVGRHGMAAHERMDGSHASKKSEERRSKLMTNLRDNGVVPNTVMGFGSHVVASELSTVNGSQIGAESSLGSDNGMGQDTIWHKPTDRESSSSSESGREPVHFDVPSVVLREASPIPSRHHRTDSLMDQVMLIKDGEDEISELLNEVRNINRATERIRQSIVDIDNGDRPSILIEEDEVTHEDAHSDISPATNYITSESGTPVSGKSAPGKIIPHLIVDEMSDQNDVSSGITPASTDMIQSDVRVGSAELELAGLAEDIHVLDKTSEDMYRQRINSAPSGVDADSVQAALATILVTDSDKTEVDDARQEGTLPTMQPNVVVWKASVSQPHTPPKELTKSFVDIEHAEKEITTLAEEIHNLNKASDEIYERRLSKDVDASHMQKVSNHKDAFLPSTTMAGETVSAVDTRIMVNHDDQSNNSDDGEPQKRAHSASASRHFANGSDQGGELSSKTSLTHPDVVVWKASVSRPHTPPHNLTQSFVEIGKAEQEIATLAQEIQVLNRSSEDIYERRVSTAMTESAVIANGSGSKE